MSTTITGTGASAAVLGGSATASDSVQGGVGLSPNVDQALNKMMSFKGNSTQNTAIARTEAAPLHMVPPSQVKTSPVPQPKASPKPAAPPAPSQMSQHDIEAHLKNLMPQNNDDVQLKTAQIQKEIDDPATPPELRSELVQFKNAVTGESRPVMNDRQMEVISTLQRHRGDFPIKKEDLQKRIDDPKTPPDLKAALQQVKDDPTLGLMLDSTNQGGGFKNVDGCLSDRDLDRLGEGADMKGYNERKAKGYVQNYIPSDAGSSVVSARMMAENDALRELYLYSDNLPKHMDKESLQKIVDGTSHGAKMPPQVIAAAQFMLDHPQSWSKVAPGGSTSRSSMLDNISKNVFLTPDEDKTLKTIDKNRDTFTKDGMTRDSLQKLVDDPATKPDVKKAAQKMLSDPLIFGMLDNAKSGHGSSLTKSADDGKIANSDLDAFLKNSKTLGKKQPELPPVHTATTPSAKKAAADMKAGEVDDPDEKRKKGGQFTDFARKVGGTLLKIAAGFEHLASIALSALSKIPIIGEIAAPLAMATEAVAGGLDIANAGLQGKDVKKAAEMAALGIAGAAISIVVAPGAGAAVMKGVETVAMKVGSQAAIAGAEKGAITVAEKGAVTGVEKAAVTSAAKGADDVAEGAASQSTKAIGKSETSAEAKARAKKEANEELKDDVKNTALDQSMANNNQQQNVQVNGGADIASMQGIQISNNLAARAALQERLDKEQEKKAHAEEIRSASGARAGTGGAPAGSNVSSTAPVVANGAMAAAARVV